MKYEENMGTAFQQTYLTLILGDEISTRWILGVTRHVVGIIRSPTNCRLYQKRNTHKKVHTRIILIYKCQGFPTARSDRYLIFKLLESCIVWRSYCCYFCFVKICFGSLFLLGFNMLFFIVTALFILPKRVSPSTT